MSLCAETKQKLCYVTHILCDETRIAGIGNHKLNILAKKVVMDYISVLTVCVCVCKWVVKPNVHFVSVRFPDKRNVEDDELPEVDQNTNKSLRSRATAAKSK